MALDPTKYNAGGGVINPYRNTFSAPAPTAPVAAPMAAPKKIVSQSFMDSRPKTIAANPGVYGVAPTPAAPISTTTTSNASGIAAVPGIIQTQNDLLADRQSYEGQNGNWYTQDASGKTVQDFDRQSDELNKQMLANIDSQTAGQIAQIQQQFVGRKQEQSRMDTAQKERLQNTLLMGGATGQGSSAQFAPVSSQGIVTAQENFGLRNLAELDRQEQQLIMAAQEAQRTGKFEVMQRMQQQIEKKRAEKVAAAAGLAEESAKRNNEMRKQNEAVAIDMGIADAYSAGTTDPTEIMKQINNAGGKVTLKQVTESLKSTVPEGLDDLMKTLRTNGAPFEVIQNTLQSRNLTDAYKSAGRFASGGTGIVGEYNFMAAQMGALGLSVPDFDTYQTQDANRKKVIAKAGRAVTTTNYGGYDKQQNKVIDQINTSISNNPSFKKSVSMQTFADNVNNALGQGSGLGDIAAINQFQKIIDEGAVTRDADVRLIQQSQSLADTLSTRVNKLKRGEQLSNQQRQEMRQLVDKVLADQRKALANDPALLAQRKKAERFEVDPDETIIGEIAPRPESTANQIISTAQQSQDKLINIARTNPAVQSIIYNKLNTVDKTLGRELTEQEVLQYLQATGRIQ